MGPLILLLVGCALAAGSPAALNRVLKAGSAESSLGLYRERLAKNPGDREALFWVARLSPSADTSAAYFSRLIDGGTADEWGLEALFRMGQYHFSRGAYGEAQVFFSKALSGSPAEGPQSAENRYWLGLSLWALSKNDSAAAVFESVTPGDSLRYGDALLALAGIATAAERYAESNRYLENALQALPPGRRGEACYALYRNYAAVQDEKNAGLYREKLLAEFPNALEAEKLRKEPASRRYALQLGAFSLRENAERLRDRLRVSHDDVDVVEIKMGGATRFHVWMGRFENKEKALAFAQSTLKIQPKDYTVRLRE